MKIYSISELSNLPDKEFLPKKLPLKAKYNGKLKLLTQSKDSIYSHWGFEHEHILLSINLDSYDYKTNINCILAHRIKLKLKNLTNEFCIVNAKVMDISGNNGEYYRVLKFNLPNIQNKLSVMYCIRDKNLARKFSLALLLKAHGASVEDEYFKNKAYEFKNIQLLKNLKTSFLAPYGYSLNDQPHSSYIINAYDLDICYSLEQNSNHGLNIDYYHKYENNFSKEQYLKFAGISKNLKYKRNIYFQSLFENQAIYNEYNSNSYNATYQACYQNIGLMRLSKKYVNNKFVSLNSIFSYVNNLRAYLPITNLILNCCLSNEKDNLILPLIATSNGLCYKSPNYDKKQKYIDKKLLTFSQDDLDKAPYSANAKDFLANFPKPIKTITVS